MIRIDETRQDTRHPDPRRRHFGRASAEAGGKRFEAEGPSAIYRIVTLLYLHGHGGEHFEVHDDVSPFGNAGGLAMSGKVRNWAELRKGAVRFNARTKGRHDFTPEEQAMVASAAGKVTTIAPRGVRHGVHRGRSNIRSAVH